MAWFVHYWDEINNRNIRSSEISAGEDAMQKACSLMEQGPRPRRSAQGLPFAPQCPALSAPAAQSIPVRNR
jgi:hypothetical protein